MTAKMLGKSKRRRWELCWCRHCRWTGRNKQEKRVHHKRPRRRFEERQWRAEMDREAS